MKCYMKCSTNEEKKALLLMTLSKFDDHSGPLIKNVNIINLHDLL